ncbi:MAG TPA: FAD-binding protein, partial [Puia sp.]|nr:FAD-binding protein [Puia sp.]
APFYPGYDTTGTMSYLRRTGHDHSWFILNQKIIRKEFALSGSEQNPELTERDWKSMLRRAWSGEAAGPVDNFRQHGDDFIIRKDLRDLVAAANLLTQSPGLDYDLVKEQVMARDLAARDLLRADGQIGAIREARRYWGDKLTRVSALHEILDPGAGPLIAVRLHLLTRKTLGGLETNLDAQVIDSTGRPIPGLYAIGEVAGFGGGGMHGYGALEGSFLGGCLFSGRTAGKAVAATLV